MPANNPQLVVYVVIDEPNVEDQAHSTYATEFASSLMMKDILPMLEIYPTGKNQTLPKQVNLNFVYHEKQSGSGSAGWRSLLILSFPQCAGAGSP